MDPNISASLASGEFAQHERVPLVLHIENPGQSVIEVADPTSGGSSLTLLLTVPGGGERVIVPSSLRAAPGVRLTEVKRRVPNSLPAKFEFDLSTLTPLGTSGTYTLVVAYAWKSGQMWRSMPIPFRVLPPSSSWLQWQGYESSRQGFVTISWAERDAKGARRLLASDVQTLAKQLSLSPASMIASVPIDATDLSGSTAPAGQPSSGRWFVWLAGAQVGGVFFEAAGDPTVPIASLRLQPGLSLVSPVLTEAHIGDAPPRAMAALLLGAREASKLMLVEIAPSGAATPGAVVELRGPSRAWCVAPDLRRRLVVVAVNQPGQCSVKGVVSSWGDPGTTTIPWCDITGELIGGDATVDGTGRALLGLVLTAGEQWQRAVCHEPVGGEKSVVTQRPLLVPPGSSLVDARLDQEGKVHVLYSSEERLCYVGPEADELEVHLPRPAEPWTNVRLMPRGKGAVTILYTDPVNGTTFKELK
jgi:hypothetical protein